MIFSMTGYGKSYAVFNGHRFEVEVKTLNNRYLEMAIKMPSTLQSLEYDVRELVKKHLKRGKVFMTINAKPESDGDSSIYYNEQRVKDIVVVLDKVRGSLGNTEAITLNHILSFRDLFTAEVEELEEGHTQALKTAVEQALSQLSDMRTKEGGELAADLNARINRIEELTQEIQARYRDDIPLYFNRTREKMKELIQDLSPFSDRLEMELALLVEKGDISEECVRLSSHIKFFRENLENGAEAGRKLNFLCQEMHREANTMASKAISTEVVHASVELREEIEKIREQVQNIE